MRFRGTRQHPVASAVAMGAGAACVAPCPAPPTVRHGEDGREKGIEGLTGGSQLAERQEVEDGPAVRWAERARWAGGLEGSGVLERT
jgi:hypothetical protein